jgi:hypothetical protein
MDSESIMMIIIMPTFLGISAWAFKTFLTFIQRRHLIKQHYVLQDRILGNLGNAPEALQYLHSDAGEKLFSQLTADRTNPYRRILSAMQAGAVLTLLGIGFLCVPMLVTFQDTEGFTVIGVLGVCLGLGFLASSAAALYFSKNWGLINGSGNDDA